MAIARLFWSGRSQAVRLPKAFRVDATEVRIRRHGAALILEPVVTDWAWLDTLAGQLEADAQQAAQEHMPQQERDALDRLFP